MFGVTKLQPNPDDQGKVEGLPPLPPLHSADEDCQEDTRAPVADQHEGDEDAHLPRGFEKIHHFFVTSFL